MKNEKVKMRDGIRMRVWEVKNRQCLRAVGRCVVKARGLSKVRVQGRSSADWGVRSAE